MPDLFSGFWERLTKEVAQSSPLDLAIKLAAAFILAAFVYVLQKSVRAAAAWLARTFPPWWNCCRKVARARAAIDENGPGLWLTIKTKPHPPKVVESLKNLGKIILTVANLKGGVGKTTLTANLAAYFANPFNDQTRPQRKVLVIDLDFQGSCSSMLFAGTEWRPGEAQLSRASELISGAINASNQGQLGQPVTKVSRARGISAFYDLARIENREMVRWLIGDESEDIRYRLAHLLLSDAVMGHFDVVLIDAPPRLTTASVQALCTSTHVLLPTILDPLSGDDPVGYFGRQLKAHEELWPHLKVLGIVGTMTETRQRTAEERVLKTAGDRLRNALQGTQGSLKYLETRGVALELPYACSMRKNTPMARAASKGVPYVAMGDNNGARIARKMFDNVGDEVERRWHL